MSVSQDLALDRTQPFEVPVARQPVRGRVTVPASKSILQRALVLDALAKAPARLHTGSEPEGDDVRCLRGALSALGRFADGALGTDRRARRLDLGLGATGFRFCLPLGALRREGARTLVTGRPALRARPHRPLLRALSSLGVRLKRRHSGAIRIHGGGARGGRVVLDGGLSSQYASALMLAAPRMGGIDIRFVGACVSSPYLHLTQDVLAAYGIEASLAGLDAPGGTIHVPAGEPQATDVTIPPDASAAAALWAAAALTGGSVLVPGLSRDGRQADLRILPILEQMGAQVESGAEGVRVTASGARLRAPGSLDLSDAPDLLPLVAALAAQAEGATEVHGIAHARAKESDRIATSVAAVRALGGRAEVGAGHRLLVEGTRLHGGCVDVARDHRIAFAFGVLGLRVSGVRLRGAHAVSKSHPRFLEALCRLAADAGDAEPAG